MTVNRRRGSAASRYALRGVLKDLRQQVKAAAALELAKLVA